MYLTKSPSWLQWFYPSLTWHKSRQEKYVYLTFDDGPIPVVTPFVLKTLKKFNAKATFFCIGDNVDKHPEIFNEILANGHRVGNHTFNHLKGWDTPDEQYLQNIKQCKAVVDSNLFRPPYGRITRSQIRKIRMQFPEMEIIMWDVLSGDFNAAVSPEKCAEKVLKNVINGSIIVFHDSEKAFPQLEYSLPMILKQLNSRDFHFKVL